MTVVEFLREKNKIIKDVTGLTLIPESQIQEVPKHKLSEYIMYSKLLGDDICPYCLVFEECKDCPMNIAGNKCDYYNCNSTWGKTSIEWRSLAKEEDILKLNALVKQYNKEIDNKVEEK